MVNIQRINDRVPHRLVATLKHTNGYAMTDIDAGRLNQSEYSEIIDPILSSPNGEKEHLHNQLIAAIYGNVTREMPDQGPAPWVSSNDKPAAGAGTKAVTGDAAERRLKGDVMQLPARDRRRIKDLVQNDVRVDFGLIVDYQLTCLMQYDPYESISNMFVAGSRRRTASTADIPASAAGGINNISMLFAAIAMSVY